MKSRTERFLAVYTWPIVCVLLAVAAFAWYSAAAGFLLFGAGAMHTIGELALRHWHARAMSAHKRRMADEGWEAEWEFTPGGIEHRMGHSPMRFQWKSAQVTRFPDGFVLAIPGAWLQYWLPAGAFPGSSADEFANLARAAAKYRTVAEAEPQAAPDRGPGGEAG